MQQLAEESHGQRRKPNSSAGCYPADAGRKAAVVQVPAVHGENISCVPRAASGWEADGGGRKRGAGVLLCGLKALYPIGWSLPAAMGVDVQE